MTLFLLQNFQKRSNKMQINRLWKPIIHVFIIVWFGLLQLNSFAQLSKGSYRPQTVIVKFKHSKFKNSSGNVVIDDDFQKFINGFHVTSIKKKFPNSIPPSNEKPGSVDISNIFEISYSIDVPVEKAVVYLSTLKDVEYAQPYYTDYHFFSDYIPNDPQLSKQWYITKIQAPAAWNISKGDTNIVIGYTDTGFDIFHEDLTSQIKYNWLDPIDGVDNDNDGYVDNFRGWDMADGDNNPSNPASITHGTTVFGIGSAKPDNAKGIAGVGFNCLVLPVKCSDQSSQIINGYEAIVYAADHGAKIINCSWGNTIKQPLGQDIIDYATFNRDALVVCASGNTNEQLTFYPASYENAISVAGTTSSDAKWTPQNTGSTGGSTYSYFVDASAPAVNMWTTTDGSAYVNGFVGTSYSAPVFSGIAGLVRSHYPQFNAIQTGEQVRITSDIIDTLAANALYQKKLGYGRVNAFNALNDSTKSSIRLIEYSIYGQTNGMMQAGDTVVLKGSFVNYLHAAKNVSVSISNLDGFLTPVDIAPVIDTLGTLDTIHNFEIRFAINTNIPKDFDTPLYISYDYESGVHDYQFVMFRANSSYLPLHSNNIFTSVTAVGSIGNTYTSFLEGEGFKYKQKDLLYGGSLILGKDTNKVLVNDILINPLELSSNSFTPETYPVYANTDSTICIKSSYSGKIPANVDFNFLINQKVTTWNNDSAFVVYEYELINTSLVDIDTMYAGLLMDWSVGDIFTNKAVVNEKGKYGYMYSMAPDMPIVGLKALRGDTIQHYLIEQNYSTNPEVKLFDANRFSKKEMFYCLSHSKPYTDPVNPLGFDMMQLMDVKKTKLKQNDTLKLAFVLFAASSEQYLMSVLNRAETRFKQLHPELVAVKEDAITSFTVVPNPSSGRNLDLMWESQKNMTSLIKIFDSQGRVIKEYTHTSKVGKNIQHIQPISKAGLYYATIMANGQTISTQFVIQ